MSAEQFGELLARAQQGDEASFTVLFRSVGPVVLRYLTALAGASAGEDIAGDTWLAVVRDLDRFVGDDISAFRAWVLSIARRRWIDQVRRRSRRPELLAAEPPERSDDSDVADEVDRIMSTERALRLVATLPPDQAEIVLLRVLGGLDVAATAALVGKTPGAVRVLAHRGLRRLAAQLQPAPSPREPVGGATGVTDSRPSTVDE